MATKKSPIYVVDSQTETGVNLLPLDATVQIVGLGFFKLVSLVSLNASSKFSDAISGGQLQPVSGGASNSNPLMDGIASAGANITYSRADHVHPSDTSKASLSGATFTGAVSGTTFVGTSFNNITGLNSTASNIKMDGVQSAGSSTSVARADHVHPSDTSRAPLISPTFSGIPNAPTASAGTNTTQIATTEFVASALLTAGLGAGQTWQNVLGSRSKGVTYTNTTGRPINVLLAVENYFTYTYFYVNGVNVTLTRDSDFGGGNSISVIVPAGATYMLTGGTTVFLWFELR